MTIDGTLFPMPLIWVATLLYVLTLALAGRLAPWRKLRDLEQLNVFLGAVVALLILWHMDVQVQSGLSFHLLGVTAITLMFGWSLAVIGASLVLLGVTLNAGVGWEGFALNAILAGVVPATLTQCFLILIRWYLPKQFFVYVLVNGFLTAGVVGVLSGYLATSLLVVSGAYSYADLRETVLPFFPLMFMPEAFLNGWILAILVAFKPQWVYSFSDEQYLKGK
ncbi:molecular chaperone DnaJ [Thiocapsa imhoffii]|uniref:Molecular chaperone DnaJ n=1 Tax=Thiocapsa imhoffii TaxID=382777 RepID=A0A9X0WF73_9GAMM|nr:energy-coupling factor ABC transporter permease [Thiocapsa imhoffii]MBK1643453.1 molecular chaperone DnaJ [Thiocapsa imhoffii]